MKNLLKLEEVALFALSLFLYNLLPYGWGLYFLLILTPDISMLGYLAGTRIGELTYDDPAVRCVVLSIEEAAGGNGPPGAEEEA